MGEDELETINWFMAEGIAVFLDIVGFITGFFGVGLVANRIITFLAGPSFALWFSFVGIKGFGWRTLMGTGGEFVPFVGDFLPFWTLTIRSIKKRHLAMKEEESADNAPLLTKEAEALYNYYEDTNI